MSAPKRKLTSLSIDQKIEILDALQSKTKTRNEVSSEYSIGMATVTRIIQQEEKIRGVALENGNTARKRLRKGNHDELDQAVRVWFRQMRAKDTFINGPMIQEVAKKFAQKLNLPNFKSSNGWLARWKAKENITFQKLKREKDGVDKSGAEDWVQKVLPRFLGQHDAKDIYAVGECGLLYKVRPGEPVATDGEQMQKDRLTTLFLCNMDGSDKHVFVIGRSKQPNCFRKQNVTLPYFANSKAWMTSSVWTNILMDFDSKMAEQNRKALVFAYNAACHRLEDGAVLRNVKVQFLPANTTSIMQPLYQGIIRAFKVHYRQKIVVKQMLAQEQGLSEQQFAKTITVTEAMKLIEECWDLVTPNTIRNCFRKAGFRKTVTEGEDPDVVDEVIQLQIPDYNFDDYIECDATLDCYGELDADDIVQEVLQQQKSDRSEEEEEEDQGTQETKKCPSYEEALAALTVLRAYFEHKNGT